jgi:hypothetical protein
MKAAASIAFALMFVFGAAAAVASDRIPQGLFEDCAGDDGQARCINRMHAMSDAGFSLVVDYSQFYGSAADQLDDASTASALGMRIIWNFSEPAFYDGTDLRAHFPTLAKTCGCSDNAGVLAYVVGLVRPLPATWGYYIADEAPVSEHARVRALSETISRLDPAHPKLIVAIGDQSPALASAHLEPFASLADVLGSDYYPVGANVPVDSVARVAANVAAVAARHHRLTAAIVQSFSWGQYPDQSTVCTPLPACARYPTSTEMRAMRDLAVKNERPSMILWYSFFDIMRSNNPQRHWADLIQASH